jgi:hypothetical protein
MRSVADQHLDHFRAAGQELSFGMSINRQTLRRAGCVAAAALLAITLGAVAPDSHGSALGPVIAITPYEVIPNIFVGIVEDPSLSGRGEAAGIYDAEVQETSFVFLDAPGQEPMIQGFGTTVSGDGCVALWARNNGSTSIFDNVSIGVTNRCTGGERELLRTSNGYQSGGGLALSFTGKYGVFVLPAVGGTVAVPASVVRIDTETGAVTPMPRHGAPYFGFDAGLGVDISDDGGVVVAVEAGTTLTAAGAPIPLRDVVAWDVASNTTAFLSGQPIQPRGSGFPSISGDGRFVSFTSAKPLTGAQRTRGPWTFVNDRTNGQIRMISVPSDSTFHTSITRDGSQVAYTVGPPNCQYNPQTLQDIEFTCQGLRVDVAYGPSPGFTSPFTTETISILANGAQGGMHMMPALSGNGQWVAWISNAGNALLASADQELQYQHAFTRRRDVGASIGALDFGTIAAGGNFTLTATLTNTGHTSLSVDSITATPGQFQVVGGGTCVGGMFLPPGATCTTNVRFNAPNNTSTINGTINFTEFGKDAVTAQNTLTGSSSFTPPPTTSTTTTTTTVAGQRPPPTTTTTTTPTNIALNADPNPVDFGQVAVGIGSPIQTVTITNVGTGSGQVLTELGGTNPDDFFVARNGCNEATLAPNESCTMDIMMIPLAGGLREASLILTAGGASGDVAMFGTGHFAPQLLASPAAITVDGFTTIVGRGFPPNQTFDLHVDPTGLVITATSDAQGQFRIPVSAAGKLGPGTTCCASTPCPTCSTSCAGNWSSCSRRSSRRAPAALSSATR